MKNIYNDQDHSIRWFSALIIHYEHCQNRLFEKEAIFWICFVFSLFNKKCNSCILIIFPSSICMVRCVLPHKSVWFATIVKCIVMYPDSLRYQIQSRFLSRFPAGSTPNDNQRLIYECSGNSCSLYLRPESWLVFFEGGLVKAGLNKGNMRKIQAALFLVFIWLCAKLQIENGCFCRKNKGSGFKPEPSRLPVGNELVCFVMFYFFLMITS